MCPLLVTLLSIVLLKEQVGLWRWAAVFAGFAGVLLVVRPGVRLLELGHLAAFGAAFVAALAIILTRSLAAERQTTILGMLCSYALIFNGVAATATGFTVPDWPTLAALVLIGAFVAAGNRLSLLSLRLSPASVIAPTHYSQMVWAVLIGTYFFNEVPDAWTLIGLAVIAGAGLLTFTRERIRLGRIRYYRLSRGRL